MAAARAEADDADLAGGVRLRPQERHAGGDVAHHLLVVGAAGRPRPRGDVVGAARTEAEEQMRGDGRIAAMGAFAHDLGGPLVPAGHVMDHDDAGNFAGTLRARVIGLALVAVVTAE